MVLSVSYIPDMHIRIISLIDMHLLSFMYHFCLSLWNVQNASLNNVGIVPLRKLDNLCYLKHKSNFLSH